MLEGHVKEIGICNRCRCSFCREGCPAFEQLLSETYSCRGRMNIAWALTEELLSYSQPVREAVYKCTLCGYCKERCGNNLDTTTILEALRSEITGQLGFLEPHKKILTSVRERGNPYGERSEERASWLPPDLKVPEEGEALYFVGCTSAYRRPEMALATVKLLKAADVDFTMLGVNEPCCGSVLLRIGYTDLAKRQAEHISAQLKRKKVSTVVTSCAGCYRTFKKDYPRSLGRFEYEVLHISEFLLRLAEQGKLTPVKRVNLSVTYHDPCHLGRHSGIYEEPRKLLESLGGLRLIEMENNRQYSTCCGAGGGVLSAFPNFALNIAKKRIREAEDIGAEALVTACPFCKTNLAKSADVKRSSIRVYDISEIALMSFSTYTLF